MDVFTSSLRQDKTLSYGAAMELKLEHDVDALFPGSDNFAAYNLFAVNDTLFFSASGSQGGGSGGSGAGGQGNGYELWRWEGDDVGTKLFKNLFPDRYITEQKFETDDETGELTLTINTAEFNASTPEFSTDSFPGNFTNAGGGNFFFTAYSTQTAKANTSGFADGLQLGGIELWFSNGTENGTYGSPSTTKLIISTTQVDLSHRQHYSMNTTQRLAAHSPII